MSLQKIQAELKAPKGQTNSFGKYKYRSCEDIVEAVKPILAKYELALLITDEIVEIGGRVYVKATAMISTEGDSKASCAIGYAREPESKKGMDESQITGAASSYARKYALNGLFAIDDTKDADTLPPEPDKPEVNLDGAQEDMVACTTESALSSVTAMIIDKYNITKDQRDILNKTYSDRLKYIKESK